MKCIRWAAIGLLGSAAAFGAEGAVHDLVIRNAMIYDGSGGRPFAGEIVIDGDRLNYVGPPGTAKGRREIDAKHQAAAPGFINMLAHPEESFFADGRALSD